MSNTTPAYNAHKFIPKILRTIGFTEFLVLTVFDRAEATGYLVKQDLPTELVEAIRRVYRGASWMPTGVARWVLELFRQELRSRSPPCCLTAREQEILNGLS